MKKPPYRTLAAEIAHLEETDPAVAKAATQLDRVVSGIIGRPVGRMLEPKCTAKVRNPKERKARPCGKPATVELEDGTFRCRHHARGRGKPVEHVLADVTAEPPTQSKENA